MGVPWMQTGECRPALIWPNTSVILHPGYWGTIVPPSLSLGLLLFSVETGRNGVIVATAECVCGKQFDVSGLQEGSEPICPACGSVAYAQWADDEAVVPVPDSDPGAGHSPPPRPAVHPPAAPNDTMAGWYL